MNEDFFKRLHLEREETKRRYLSLEVFLEAPFVNVSSEELEIMKEQHQAMGNYLRCLDARIGIHQKNISKPVVA